MIQARTRAHHPELNNCRFYGHSQFTWSQLPFCHNSFRCPAQVKQKPLPHTTCLHWEAIEPCIFWIGRTGTGRKSISTTGSLLELAYFRLFSIWTFSTFILQSKILSSCVVSATWSRQTLNPYENEMYIGFSRESNLDYQPSRSFIKI